MRDVAGFAPGQANAVESIVARCLEKSMGLELEQFRAELASMRKEYTTAENRLQSRMEAVDARRHEEHATNATELSVLKGRLERALPAFGERDASTAQIAEAVHSSSLDTAHALRQVTTLRERLDSDLGDLWAKVNELFAAQADERRLPDLQRRLKNSIAEEMDAFRSDRVATEARLESRLEAVDTTRREDRSAMLTKFSEFEGRLDGTLPALAALQDVERRSSEIRVETKRICEETAATSREGLADFAERLRALEHRSLAMATAQVSNSGEVASREKFERDLGNFKVEMASKIAALREEGAATSARLEGIVDASEATRRDAASAADEELTQIRVEADAQATRVREAQMASAQELNARLDAVEASWRQEREATAGQLSILKGRFDGILPTLAGHHEVERAFGEARADTACKIEAVAASARAEFGPLAENMRSLQVAVASLEGWRPNAEASNKRSESLERRTATVESRTAELAEAVTSCSEAAALAARQGAQSQLEEVQKQMRMAEVALRTVSENLGRLGARVDNGIDRIQRQANSCEAKCAEAIQRCSEVEELLHTFAEKEVVSALVLDADKLKGRADDFDRRLLAADALVLDVKANAAERSEMGRTDSMLRQEIRSMGGECKAEARAIVAVVRDRLAEMSFEWRSTEQALDELRQDMPAPSRYSPATVLESAEDQHEQESVKRRDLQGVAAMPHFSTDSVVDRYSKQSALALDKSMRPLASTPEQPSEVLQQPGHLVTFEAPSSPNQAFPMSMSIQPPGPPLTSRRPASAVPAGRFSLATGRMPSPSQIASARPTSARVPAAPHAGSVPMARTDRTDAILQRHNKAKDIRAEVSNIRFSGGLGTVCSDYIFSNNRSRSTPAGTQSAR